MRKALTHTLALLILVFGVLTATGLHSLAAKDRMSCCQKPAKAKGCDRTAKPMPCCELRPAPAPIADVPPSSPRWETPTYETLHVVLLQAVFSGSQPGGTAFRPHRRPAPFSPAHLYQLSSAYLI